MLRRDDATPASQLLGLLVLGARAGQLDAAALVNRRIAPIVVKVDRELDRYSLVWLASARDGRARRRLLVAVFR